MAIKRVVCAGILAGFCLLVPSFLSSCKKGQEGERGKAGESEGVTVIQNTGSDTMVNLAQEWAEAYAKVNPKVRVEVSGGGSGVGIASLIQGTVDIANSSRKLTESERKEVVKHTGREPREFIVAYDALAVYVHKDNPVEELSIDELREIFAQGGKITRWSQLGVKNSQDQIVVFSRQNNSGTYFYFREHVLGNKEYRLSAIKSSGSRDVVVGVGRTPGGIGYSGLGYYDPKLVKTVKISRKKGEPAYPPTLETVRNGTYPLARPLHMYTLGEPEGEIKKYIDWILSPEGQKIVEKVGYVPIEVAEAGAEKASQRKSSK